MRFINGRQLFGALALTALFFGVTGTAQAQQGTITGRVIDQATQASVIGAQVLIAGTTRGSFTGPEGRYRIGNVTPGQVQLRVRVIGYATVTQTVTVGVGETVVVDIALVASAVALDAVLVTATGEEQRRRELGHAVDVIPAADITEKAPVTNFADLLNSRAAGVVTTTPSGSTGDGARIRIRGSNSLSLSNEPSVYIDGVRVENNPRSTTIGVGGQQPSRINDLNPEDIESIVVVKGPSAVGLYGTGGANGVIQIRTKQGRAGPARWNFYAEGGTLADYTEYPANWTSDCLLVDQADGSCSQTPDSLRSFNPLEVNSPFRTGFRQQYGLNVSGGSEAVTYFVSGEFEHENGIYEINTLRKRNLRANLRSHVSERLDLAVSTGYVSSNLRRPQNDNNSFGILASGLLGLTDTTNDGYGFLTPEQSMSVETRQGIERFTGSLSADWHPNTFLRARAVVGIDVTNRFDQETTFPGEIPASFSITAFEGDREANRDQIYQTTANFSATASFDLSPIVRSNTSAGVQYFRDYATGNRAFGRKLVAGSTSLAGAVVPSVNEVTAEAVTIGGFVEEQIGIRDRLFFTAAVRGDDNSAFGKDFDFITYPKFSASWVISEEPFFPVSGTISSLRLRAAYGLSGLQPGPTDAAQFFDPVAVTVAGVDVPGFTVGNLGNPNLKPEKSREFELGFDADLFRERVRLEFTYYDKKSRDALIARRLAPSLGSSDTRFENLGEVSNKGVEVSVNARVLSRPEAAWDVNVSAWGNRNRLIELGAGIEPIIFGLGGASQRHQEGFPVGSYFIVPFTHSDANGDGLIGSNEVTLGTEETYHGTPFPTHGGTLSTSLTLWNRVRIYGLLDGRFGHTANNSTEDFRCLFVICQALHDPSSSVQEQARALADALLPVTTESGFFEDADFVKLREISVTFFAPDEWAARLGAGGLSLTVSGRNLATWTDYTGLDPEIANNPTNFNTAEFLTQPLVRYFTARINVNF